MNRPCPPRHPTRAGFTLLEVMIVVAVAAMFMAWGVPQVVRSLKKDAFHQAASDVMEACSHARARAILQGRPMELIIRADTGSLRIEPMSPRQIYSATNQAGLGRWGGPEVPVAEPGTNTVPIKPFTANLPEDVAVELLDVNFRDHMGEDEARVRFFPNGTCDEFTVVLRATDGQRRKISLEVVTSLAGMEVIR
jgi:prepilin-type N-terminal cleavage/methylation domain-containing protein